jgi:hypothetical protein
VWNSAFPQHNYVISQAATQNPAVDNTQFYALRARTVGGIFKSALGATRTVAVLGAQAVNPWTATWGLDYLKGRFGSGAVGIDAVAIAPYMSVSPDPTGAGQFTAMTLDTFFGYVSTQVVPATTAATAAYRTVANNYGVHLISYEGGQSLVGILGAENNTDLTAVFDNFNRDPRAKDVYLAYLAGWRQAGGELFVHFNDAGVYSKWGDWGSLEYIDQPRATAPKFDGVQTFIEKNPVWWNQ